MNKKYKYVLIIGVMFFAIFFSKHVHAEDNENDVVITTTILNNIYIKIFSVPIKIKFFNPELYNNELYLSYHIYSTKNDEAIVYENTRYKIELDNEGKMSTEIVVNLNGIKDLNKYKNLEIRFDIVDEENAYWYTSNHNIKLVTNSVYYEKDFWKNIKVSFINTILDKPYIFTINLICCLFFISLYHIIRKKEIL